MQINSEIFERTYSQAEVAYAAGCTENAMINYIFKNHLPTCSEASGRGRKRHFPIIDVMQVSLMTAMVKLSRDAQGSAKICESLLLSGENAMPSESSLLVDSETGEYVEVAELPAQDPVAPKDHQSAPRPYQEFDLQYPWVLMFEVSNEGQVSKGSCNRWGEDRFWSSPNVQMGYYLNLTQIFVDALARLQQK